MHLLGTPHTGVEEDPAVHTQLMLETFQSIALIIHVLCEISTVIPSIRFALILQGDQFSRWIVRRAALQAGFRFCGWCQFDETDFPGYHPARASGELFPATDTRFYTFVAMVRDLEGH